MNATPHGGTGHAAYWPAGTVYGTLLNFRDELEHLAPQMNQPPYKAPPKAPVLYVKTANTWSASGADVPVPPSIASIEVGATIAMTRACELRFSREGRRLGAHEYASTGAAEFIAHSLEPHPPCTARMPF